MSHHVPAVLGVPEVPEVPLSVPGAPLFRAALLALALFATGCFQLETRVKINEDGTAKVTERIWFSERLLDLAGDKRGEFVALLGKDRLQERMKQMGEGLTLVKHETHEGGDGWMESVAEISVPDLNKFRYVSPWPAFMDYASNNMVRFQLTPQYKSSPYGGASAGSMAIKLQYERPPQGRPAPPKDAPPKEDLTPKEQQAYRDITPVVKDMLKGFHIRLSIESYAAIHSGFGVRGAGATVMDLLDVSDANMDQWSTPFWSNEEVMLEVARWDLGGPNIVRNVQGYVQNWTLPVFYPAGSPNCWWTGSDSIYFAPSKALFDKHFEGKKLDFSPWQAAPPDQHVPARFKEIGWNGYAAERDGDAGKAAK